MVDFPKLKVSEEQEYLSCLANNIRMCCKVFGTKKIAFVMGTTEKTVYNRILNPKNITKVEIFRLSRYTGVEMADFDSPLNLSAKGR